MNPVKGACPTSSRTNEGCPKGGEIAQQSQDEFPAYKHIFLHSLISFFHPYTRDFAQLSRDTIGKSLRNDDERRREESLEDGVTVLKEEREKIWREKERCRRRIGG